MVFLAATGVFAQYAGFSIGGGGFIGGELGGGIQITDPSGTTGTIKIPYFGGGGYIFLDIPYAEFYTGFFGGGGKIEISGGGTSISQDMSFMSLNIGLLGKYPFNIAHNMAIFPMLGLEYQIMLSAQNSDGIQYKNPKNKESPGDFSALWVKFGGGMDYFFNRNDYLRVEALYAVRFANQVENDMKNQYTPYAKDVKTLLGNGPTIKIGFGYKF